MVDAIERFDGTREKFIGDAVFAVFGWPVAHDDDALRADPLRARDPGRARPPRGSVGRGRSRSGSGSRPARSSPRRASVPGRPGLVADRADGHDRDPDPGLAEPGEILLDEATSGPPASASTSRISASASSAASAGRSGSAGCSARPGSSRGSRPTAGSSAGSAERALLRGVARPTCATDRPRRDASSSTATPGSASRGSWPDLEAEARRAGLAWTWVDNVSYGAAEPYRFARSLAQIDRRRARRPTPGSFARRLLFTDDVDPDDGAPLGRAHRRDRPRRGVLRLGGRGGPRPARSGRGRAATCARVAGRATSSACSSSTARGCSSSTTSTGSTRRAPASSRSSSASRRRLPLVVLVASRPGRACPPGPTTRRPSDRARRASTRPRPASSRGRVAGAAVDADDVHRLHARTGGNPLFVGETVRAIVDEGAITERRPARDRTGRGAPTVPVTLRALLGSRIDAPVGRGADRPPGRLGHRDDVPRADRRGRPRRARRRRRSTSGSRRRR